LDCRAVIEARDKHRDSGRRHFPLNQPTALPLAIAK
jgi:hypothetical protein